MESAPKTEKIDWNTFTDDESVKEKLRDLVRGVRVSSIQLRGAPKEEVERTIREHIASAGFPSEVSVSVSEPNEVGQRMVMGMARSPLTRKTISF